MELVFRSAQHGGWRVRTAWLAQRESAIGDWDAVRPPLREGDELQLTVLSSQDACVYLFDGERRQIFPTEAPPDAPPSLARIRAGWPYALPGPHRTWRLDGAAHDRIYLVAARHPLADPARMLGASGPTVTEPAGALELPLRDGRSGAAPARTLISDGEVMVDVFEAR